MKMPKYFYTFAALFVMSGALFQGCSTSQTGTDNSAGSAGVSTAAANQNFKDGIYIEKPFYNSPAGTENIVVTFVLKNNLVSDFQLTSSTTNGMSLHYQQLFTDGVKPQVIGKNLNDIGIFGRVNGSSLTSGGFNSAVSQLKIDAKV
jgi:hypothetical protein